MEMVQPREDDIGHISDKPTIFGNEGLEDDDSEEPSEEDFPSAPDSTGQTTARNALDGESPIAYYYLTFDTTLPSPSTSLATDALGVLATPPPDLARYTSPFDWPESRKNFTMSLSCIATAITAYTAGSYAPASSYMAAEWNVSRVAVTVGITTFCAGFAMAPMALAPFSEINGRYPVFVGAGILYLICQVCCAVT
ncbi:unnamed protein product, partial [Diplocarpon coronariae]